MWPPNIDMNLNADIGKVLRNLFSKEKSKSGDSGKQNPFLKLILSGLVIIVSVVLYVVLVFIPARQDIYMKEGRVDQIGQINNEIATLNEKILSARIALDMAKTQHESLTRLFHTDQELEDLYRNISMLALTHQLLVLKLEKAGEEPVFEMEADIDQHTNDDTEFSESEENYDGGIMDESQSKSTKKKIAYFRLGVKFDISGNYSRYTLFRRDLAKLTKIINIDKETIIVVDSDKKNGEVNVSATLSTYRLPAEDEVYQDGDDMQIMDYYNG